MGVLALIVIAHMLWTRHASQPTPGDENATTSDGVATTTPVPSTAPASVTQLPASWPTYRGDAAMTGVCPGRIGTNITLAWRFKTDDKVLSSPVIDGWRVFIGSGDGDVYCISLASGHQMWSYKTDGAVTAPPLLLGDSLIVGSEDGNIYCLKASNGSVRWSHPTHSKVVAAANSYTTKDGRVCVVVGSWDYNLYSLDVQSGRLEWTIKTANYVNGPCSVEGGRGVFGGCDTNVYTVDLQAGRLVRQTSTGSPIPSAVALRGGKGYVGNYGQSNAPAGANGGEFFIMDLASGELGPPSHFEGPFLAPPAVSDKYIVLATGNMEAGHVHCITHDGTGVWDVATDDAIESGPLIIGDKVLVGGNDKYLRLLSMKDGKSLWTYRLGGAIKSSPAAAAGYVVVGCSDGYVYAFKAE